MEDENVYFVSEEARKFHEEFLRCETIEEIMELAKREQKRNETRCNLDIPHLDMTYEEFLEKYNCVDSEEIRKKYDI